MDYDFWMRAYLAGVPLRRVPDVLAVMGDRGISSQRDWNGLYARFLEEQKVQNKHAEGAIWRWMYRTYWPLYLGFRRMGYVCGRKQ
jgi:hypothetical protein